MINKAWIFSLLVTFVTIGIMLFLAWTEITKEMPNPAWAWGLFVAAYLLFMWAVLMVGNRRRECITHGQNFKHCKSNSKEPIGFATNGKAHNQNKGHAK